MTPGSTCAMVNIGSPTSIFLCGTVFFGCADKREGSQPSSGGVQRARRKTAGPQAGAPAPLAKRANTSPNSEVPTQPRGLTRGDKPSLKLTLHSVDGQALSLADIVRGRSSLVALYWGHRCPYFGIDCRAMLVDLARSHEELRARGVTVVAIAADKERVRTQFQDLIERQSIPFPVLFDSELGAHRAFGVVGRVDASEVEEMRQAGIRIDGDDGPSAGLYTVPAMYLLNPQGQVVWSHLLTTDRHRLGKAEIFEILDKADLRPTP